MLGEADLMALDEDLQEVPWGLVAPTRGDNQQILSPLAALGARLARGYLRVRANTVAAMRIWRLRSEPRAPASK